MLADRADRKGASSQIEGYKIEGAALALDGEVECLFFAQTLGQLAGEALAVDTGLDRNTEDRLAVRTVTAQPLP